MRLNYSLWPFIFIASLRCFVFPKSFSASIIFFCHFNLYILYTCFNIFNLYRLLLHMLLLGFRMHLHIGTFGLAWDGANDWFLLIFELWWSSYSFWSRALFVSVIATRLTCCSQTPCSRTFGSVAYFSSCASLWLFGIVNPPCFHISAQFDADGLQT